MSTTTHKKYRKRQTYGGIGDYKILKKLEGGSQATILIGEDKSQSEVIIKIFKQQKIFRREAKYLSKVAGGHQNLIKVLDIFQDTPIVTFKNGKKVTQNVNAIVMEKGKVDLFQLISKTEKFSEMTCRYFFKELLNAVFYCHA